ncbi:MAG: hydroxymethylglutaryl-CoA lyase, partial [Phycisphaeraceae bacterium]|nr:hydroxymethylglutaryl-CoA lyase [Phycisphaeraceae bacterium]
MLHAMGYDTGLDLEAIAEAGPFIEDVLGREPPGRYHLYHRGSSSRDRGAETA